MKKNQNQNQTLGRMFSNPLSEIDTNVQLTLRHSRSCSNTCHYVADNKENANLNNVVSTNRILKPSSLQFCMQINDPSSDSSHFSSSLKIWDHSDSEAAAPASSWSTLPNKSLICRPLPIDIGRCTCVIVKEPTPQGPNLFSLYTYVCISIYSLPFYSILFYSIILLL